MRFQRLRADRRKEHLVQAQGVACCARHGQMAAMGRIEAAAKVCDPSAIGRLKDHGFMVSRALW
jgi:hypothetical protein